MIELRLNHYSKPLLRYVAYIALFGNIWVRASQRINSDTLYVLGHLPKGQKIPNGLKTLRRFVISIMSPPLYHAYRAFMRKCVKLCASSVFTDAWRLEKTLKPKVHTIDTTLAEKWFIYIDIYIYIWPIRVTVKYDSINPNNSNGFPSRF